MNADIQAKIAEMVRRIVDGFHPQKIILFGSHARGAAGFNSDVDLIVVLPHVVSKRKIRVAIREAVSGAGISKDILVYSPEEMERYRHLPGSLVRSVADEGEVLYEHIA